MSLLEQMKQQLMRDEGSKIVNGRHYPYTDTVGKTTVGWGRNLTDRGLSEDEAQLMLENDVVIAIGELVARFPWFEHLDEVRQGALVNLCFNMGSARLAKFHTTLGFLRAGNYENASISLLQSKYADQVGNRALRVAEQIRSGQWV